MNTKYDIKIPTLVERLQEEGYQKVAECDARSPFPIGIVRADRKGPLDELPGVELRIVDKAEFDNNYKPGKAYEIYRKYTKFIPLFILDEIKRRTKKEE